MQKSFTLYILNYELDNYRYIDPNQVRDRFINHLKMGRAANIGKRRFTENFIPVTITLTWREQTK